MKEMLERSVREAQTAVNLIDDIGVFRVDGLTRTQWCEILAMREAELATWKDGK